MGVGERFAVEETFGQAKKGFDVAIAAVASAVPRHKVSQEVIAEGAKRFFPHLNGLASVFANTGIETRYVSEMPDWYLENRGWEERTAAFQRNAGMLLEQVTKKEVVAAQIELEDIRELVVNTHTGLAI